MKAFRRTFVAIAGLGTLFLLPVASPFAAAHGQNANATIWKAAANEMETAMQISISTEQVTLVYDLNDSQAAQELYDQLPMEIEVENYGGIEKIFYPPKKLSTVDTPLARNVRSGTLAYYAPWGDVVMFYDSFGAAPGLYELGRILSGQDEIERLSGTIRVEKVGAN